MIKLAKIFVFGLMSGCSLYTSEGRKFLEANAYQFAASAAQAHLVSCGSPPSPATVWTEISTDERAAIASSEGESYELKVTPKGNPDASCFYKFSSAQEMYQKSEAAVDLTLYLSLGECSGEFAFQTACNLK